LSGVRAAAEAFGPLGRQGNQSRKEARTVRRSQGADWQSYQEKVGEVSGAGEENGGVKIDSESCGKRCTGEGGVWGACSVA